MNKIALIITDYALPLEQDIFPTTFTLKINDYEI